MKEVNTQNFWTVELGTQEIINIPFWIVNGFQQRERQDSQKSNNDPIYRPPKTSAQDSVGTEIYPDSALLLKYADEGYSQGYSQSKETFGALPKDDIPVFI